MKLTRVVNPQPGDYGLVHGSGFLMALVRWGTRSEYGHARLCVGYGPGDTIAIVEAQPPGAVTRVLSAWETQVTAWFTVDPTNTQRIAIANNGRDLVGIGYGWTDIAALAAWHVLGLRWRWLDRRINREDRLICSQLVALAYARAGIDLIPDQLPCEDTPADLAHATPTEET